jgi:hypothetical protein
MFCSLWLKATQTIAHSGRRAISFPYGRRIFSLHVPERQMVGQPMGQTMPNPEIDYSNGACREPEAERLDGAPCRT